MTVTSIILIVIAMLSLNRPREKWSRLFSWHWLSKILFCGRNLYVDALQFDIHDPDVSTFFFWCKVMVEWFWQALNTWSFKSKFNFCCVLYQHAWRFAGTCVKMMKTSDIF
jgi:hypothetical protein